MSRAPEGFALTSNGRYFHRYGPAYEEGGTYANVKLCFIGTDRDAVISVLEECARRTDCVFLNLSAKPKEGMWVGRCFLTNRIALGQLWAELKNHPKLFVTVQDDDFLRPYRHKGPTS